MFLVSYPEIERTVYFCIVITPDVLYFDRQVLFGKRRRYIIPITKINCAGKATRSIREGVVRGWQMAGKTCPFPDDGALLLAAHVALLVCSCSFCMDMDGTCPSLCRSPLRYQPATLGLGSQHDDTCLVWTRRDGTSSGRRQHPSLVGHGALSATQMRESKTQSGRGVTFREAGDETAELTSILDHTQVHLF
jgi:hypothetical protein